MSYARHFHRKQTLHSALYADRLLFGGSNIILDRRIWAGPSSSRLTSLRSAARLRRASPALAAIKPICSAGRCNRTGSSEPHHIRRKLFAKVWQSCAADQPWGGHGLADPSKAPARSTATLCLRPNGAPREKPFPKPCTLVHVPVTISVPGEGPAEALRGEVHSLSTRHI